MTMKKQIMVKGKCAFKRSPDCTRLQGESLKMISDIVDRGDDVKTQLTIMRTDYTKIELELRAQVANLAKLHLEVMADLAFAGKDLNANSMSAQQKRE